MREISAAQQRFGAWKDLEWDINRVSHETNDCAQQSFETCVKQYCLRLYNMAYNSKGVYDQILNEICKSNIKVRDFANDIHIL